MAPLANAEEVSFEGQLPKGKFVIKIVLKMLKSSKIHSNFNDTTLMRRYAAALKLWGQRKCNLFQYLPRKRLRFAIC